MTRTTQLTAGAVAALALTAAALTVGPTVVQSAQAQPLSGTVQIPVSFSVQNVNRSVLSCNADGETYDVAGTLTAPAAALDDPDGAVTLYQHGANAGEWYWNLPVQGYNHVREMAERGHVSVSIDRVGYDDSGFPSGTETCIGAQADMTHQIVEQLRSGDYTGERAPAFDRVALAGHSNGGLIAGLAAVSFGDVDAVSVHGWGDVGGTPLSDERFGATTVRCVSQQVPGAEPGLGAGDATVAPADLPRGYSYFEDGTPEYLESNFADTEQTVLDAAAPLQNAIPCGDLSSIGPGVQQSLQTIGGIDVPVQVVAGEADAYSQGLDSQSALYSGAPSVDSVLVPGAGHYTGLSRQAALVHDRMSQWLTAHGLA